MPKVQTDILGPVNEYDPSAAELHTSKFGFLGENSDRSGTRQPRLRMTGCTCLATRCNKASACMEESDETAPAISVLDWGEYAMIPLRYRVSEGL